MPTIDQLAPATAASDTDEMLVSQNGVARKITRRQVIAGLQPELLIASGSLLGRMSTGIGDPEPVAVGANLAINNGTLSAAAAPFSVAVLPGGVVPAPGDLVPLAQGGANAAVPYSQFVAGLPGVPGIDGSSLTVKPTGQANARKLSDLTASFLPTGGGTMTGGLTLATGPSNILDAATKGYVDAGVAAQLSRTGGTLSGPLTLAADPAQPLQATTRQYVDAMAAKKLDLTVTVPQTMAGQLHLTSFYSEQEGSASTDYAVLNSRYTVTHSGGSTSVNSNARLDTTVLGSPNTYVWGLTSALNYQGVGGTGQHVAVYAQVLRNAVSPGGASANPELWAATMESRDLTGRPSSASNSQTAVELDLIANGLDDGGPGGGGVRSIQSLVIGQHDSAGTPVEVGVGSGYYLAAGSQGSFKQVVHIGAPFSQSAFDTRIGTQLAGAHAIWLADGHHIALNSAGTRYLAWDGATDELRYYRNGFFTPLGSGISFNSELVLSGSATLLLAYAGYAVFLANSASATVTLPSAGTMQFGTGFTFLATGSASVSIATVAGNTIDNGPITLLTGDRYTIISDGAGSWREVYRTNSVQTRFSSPPVLPSYTVAALPSGPVPGSKAYASNGRKGADPSGNGTGVEVFADSTGRWFSVAGGGVVQA